MHLRQQARKGKSDAYSSETNKKNFKQLNLPSHPPFIQRHQQKQQQQKTRPFFLFKRSRSRSRTQPNPLSSNEQKKKFHPPDSPNSALSRTFFPKSHSPSSTHKPPPSPKILLKYSRINQLETYPYNQDKSKSFPTLLHPPPLSNQNPHFPLSRIHPLSSPN